MLQTFLKSLKQAASGLSVLRTSCEVAPGQALAETSLGSHFGPSWGPPCPAQGAAICRLLCSSGRVAPCKAQAEQKHTQIYSEHFDGCRKGVEDGGLGYKDEGIKKYKLVVTE